MKALIAWMRLVLKHNYNCHFEYEEMPTLGVNVVRAKCKCGWRSPDHGKTDTGHRMALEDFLDHQRAEGLA